MIMGGRNQKTTSQLIEQVKKDACEGIRQPREVILRLLEIPIETEAYMELCRAAKEAAMWLTGKEAYLWGAIGVDYKPCPMNCKFCSLGEKWNLVKEEKSYTEEEIINQIREYVNAGVRFVVLRTTEFYRVDVLCEFLKNIRRQIQGEYELILNIGEFDEETAKEIYDSGAGGIYHALRLREGTDTLFSPQERVNTLISIQKSPLRLIHLIEPIGPEHTNEEIADVFINALEYGAVITGAMARIPVPGTPLGDSVVLDKKRIAQIVAVTRLCAGKQVKDICVHPASEEAIMAGANVMVVERGAIPRDSALAEGMWEQFDAVKAKRLFERQGYQVVQKRAF